MPEQFHDKHWQYGRVLKLDEKFGLGYVAKIDTPAVFSKIHGLDTSVEGTHFSARPFVFSFDTVRAKAGQSLHDIGLADGVTVSFNTDDRGRIIDLVVVEP